MKSPMLVAVLCLVSLGLTDAIKFCHYKTPMEGFNMDQFLGKWYWAMETPNVYSLRGDKCPISILQRRENGTFAYTLKYLITGETEYTTKEGNMWRCSASETDGKLVFAMPTQHGYWEARMWILGTDYTNYAASYACWFSANGELRSWAMGWCREKVCSEENKNTIKRILIEHEIDANTLEDLDTNCPEP